MILWVFRFVRDLYWHIPAGLLSLSLVAGRRASPDLSGREVINSWPTAFPEHWLAFLVSPAAHRFFKGRVDNGVVNEHLCPPVNPPHHLIPSEIKHLHSNALVFAGLQEKKDCAAHLFEGFARHDCARSLRGNLLQEIPHLLKSLCFPRPISCLSRFT